MGTEAKDEARVDERFHPDAEDVYQTDTWDLAAFDSVAERPAPYSSRVAVEFEALSDQGRVRKRNEDAFLVYRASRSWERLRTSLPEDDLPSQFDETAYVFCVADGMGGAAGGDVASRLALQTGATLVLNSAKWWLKMDHPHSRETAMRAFTARARRRFRQIDQVLVGRASGDPALSGMGTTLTVACSFGADLFVLNSGDSRAYLFRRGHLQQLTRDQTLAQAMLDAGQFTPEQAKGHRWQHVLTGVLGGPGSMEAPAIGIHRLEDGDQLLLCTDGLSNMLEDPEITEIIAGGGSVADHCRQLVDGALQQGGRDNITAILAHYTLPARS